MPGKIIRAAIVGASSLLGKEVAEELNAAASTQWELTLLDPGGTETQLTTAGEEAAVIVPLEADSFIAQDVVFFTDNAAISREYWKAAAAAGAAIVDFTGGLEGQPNVIVSAPWIKKDNNVLSGPVDLATVAAVSAHPAAIMLGLVLSRLREKFTVVRAAATVLEPASQQGSAGLDEMHGQTVGLLSFQSLPKDVFDAQVAFNLSATLGGAARADLATVSQGIRRHLEAIAGAETAGLCAVQLIQAPVFNGYTASVFVELGEEAAIPAISALLDGGVIGIPDSDDVAPSNQAATEQGKLLLQLRAEPAITTQGSGFWLWMAADNLRLAARNGVASATELLAMKPGGRLQ
ncbi:MAG TPA: Asd/ArgC dimerization domain-containing protein [Acidobacteriaceae bacterium]|jgi:aspartate-semialdehyde dehydrogenase